MKIQTAVEYIQDNFSMNKTLGEIKIIIATAKEMEKQQIADAYNEAIYDHRQNDGEQYYNETFKSE